MLVTFSECSVNKYNFVTIIFKFPKGYRLSQIDLNCELLDSKSYSNYYWKTGHFPYHITLEEGANGSAGGGAGGTAGAVGGFCLL
jgi:hypothetical protein